MWNYMIGLQFFDKMSSSCDDKSGNRSSQELAEELQKPITREFEK